jgi:hypothetical protein
MMQVTSAHISIYGCAVFKCLGILQRRKVTCTVECTEHPIRWVRFGTHPHNREDIHKLVMCIRQLSNVVGN